MRKSYFIFNDNLREDTAIDVYYDTVFCESGQEKDWLAVGNPPNPPYQGGIRKLKAGFGNPWTITPLIKGE